MDQSESELSIHQPAPEPQISPQLAQHLWFPMPFPWLRAGGLGTRMGTWAACVHLGEAGRAIYSG